MHAHAATANPRSVLERHCIEAIDKLRKMSWKHDYTSKTTTVCLYPVYIWHLPFKRVFLYSDLVRQQHKSDELLDAQDELLFTALQHYQANDYIHFDRRARVPQKSLESDHQRGDYGSNNNDPMTSMRAWSTSLTNIH